MDSIQRRNVGLRLSLYFLVKLFASEQIGLTYFRHGRKRVQVQRGNRSEIRCLSYIFYAGGIRLLFQSHSVSIFKWKWPRAKLSNISFLFSPLHMGRLAGYLIPSRSVPANARPSIFKFTAKGDYYHKSCKTSVLSLPPSPIHATAVVPWECPYD